MIEKKDYILPSGVLSSGLLPVFDARGFSGSNANLSSDRASLAWVRDQSQMKIGLGPVLSGLGVAVPTVPPVIWPAVLEGRELAARSLIWNPALPSSVVDMLDLLRGLGVAAVSTCGSSNPGVSFRVLGRTFREPNVLTDLPLAPVTPSSLRLDVLRSLDAIHGDGKCTAWLSLISSEAAFTALFIEPPKRSLRRTAMSNENQAAMDLWRLTESAPWDPDEVPMKAFLVPKKELNARLVVDASPVNAAQIKPDNMGLPPLHEFLAEMCRYQCVATKDATSFFYQFEVEAGSRRYFTLLFNRARGAPSRRVLRKMCMGWKFAPGIAQSTSNLLCKVLKDRLRGVVDDFMVMCWVDNFVFATHNEADLATVLAAFDALAVEVNLEMHPVKKSSPGKPLVVLGFLVVNGALVHEPSWLDGFDAALEAASRGPCSLRQAAKVVGKLLWAAFARRHPIADLPATMALTQVIAAFLATGSSDWDSELQVDASAAWMEMRAFRTVMGSAFLPRSRWDKKWAVFYSDAMADAHAATWGWVSDKSVAFGTFADTEAHIFLHEFRAFAQAASSAARDNPHQRALFFVDAAAVVFAVRAGHSSNATVNSWIARLFRELPRSFEFMVCHVEGVRNPADIWTRDPQSMLLPSAPGAPHVVSDAWSWPLTSVRLMG